jgi:RNA polymerase sigma-70 factor (ECF subfamily)
MTDGAQHASNWSALMAAAQDGDGRCYRQLLGEITPYIRQIARRRLRNPTDIEDAVQDVLLTIHTIRQTYDPARPFGPWLATIADRRVLDLGRKLKRRAPREDALGPEHETFHAEPANLYPETLMNRDVARALQDLPEGQRRAVELVNVQGLDLAEAARISGQSVGSIKVAVHRALKALRARFEERE